MWALVVLGAGIVGYFSERADCEYNAAQAVGVATKCVYAQKPLAVYQVYGLPARPAKVVPIDVNILPLVDDKEAAKYLDGGK